MIKTLLAAVVLGLACAWSASAQEPPPGATPQANAKGVAEILTDYPSIAIRRREQGDVRLSMCVNETGRAYNIKLVQSSGSKALDEASLKGARNNLIFRPGLDPDGKPVDWCDPPYEMTFAWRLTSN